MARKDMSEPTGADGAGRSVQPSSGPSMRVAGIALACSTPISGLLSYALVAIVLGESRLEGDDGLTIAGMVVLGLPLILGAALAVWNPPVPSRQVLGIVAAAVAGAFVGVGLWSSSRSAALGDASIGGGLLVLAAVPTGVAAIVLLWKHKDTSGS
jgi:hypothetical protein